MQKRKRLILHSKCSCKNEDFYFEGEEKKIKEDINHRVLCSKCGKPVEKTWR